jgi:hypothetical protein
MVTKATVKRNVYLGLFTVTLAVLMYETLLTRIFSVTMWYHFAFVAVSVAMFGMTVGGILVYLLPHRFTQDRTEYHLALSSLGFSVSTVVSFLLHLGIIQLASPGSIVLLYSLTYVVVSIPFVFAGICVSLAVTRFPLQVSKLYAADLAGAALGCWMVIIIMKITDGPTAVFVAALFGCIGSVLFAVGGRYVKLLRITVLSGLLLASFVIINTVLVGRQASLLRLTWAKGSVVERPLYEKWNSFSRISVTGNPHEPEAPVGWGLSSLCPLPEVRQLHMTIDAAAETVLTAHTGTLDDLEYLKCDVTNIVHHVRPGSKVLIIGTGGGRDILSALVFEQDEIIGVEINEDIIATTNEAFGDFTGYLNGNPQVIFVNDEARSYIARQKDSYDIIQASLIDTWAANAAGAFVLSENALYTVEAWNIFLEHLTPDGVLTFSRWYFRDRPGEMYRLTSLANVSLRQMGVENPREHIVIVRYLQGTEGDDAPDGIGTILVGKRPFSDEDLDELSAVIEEMGFELVLSPRVTLDPTFAAVASERDIGVFAAGFPINIAPPTDDSPFFFNMLRPKDIFSRELWAQGVMGFNLTAVSTLVALLIIVVDLALLCIIVPLVIAARKAMPRPTAETVSLFVFFASIGLGFMLVEVSQMQRLIIFLGHPTYSLSVVLFALLSSSGFGSLLTRKIDTSHKANLAIICLVLLLCMLVAFGVLTPRAISAFHRSPTPVRILLAVVMLLPLGLFMGMAFPLGMKLASTESSALTTWLWGINGASSICASVFAVAIAIGSSISTSFWVGAFCYLIALAAFVWARRS